MPGPDIWSQSLPQGYEGLLVLPHAFEFHEDELALATKWIGFDSQGRRCFVRHDHTVLAGCDGAGRLPLRLPIEHVRHTAWRLQQSGRWLLQVDHTQRLDDATSHTVRRRMVVICEASLGL